MCISQMLSKHILYGSIDNDIYIEVEIWADRLGQADIRPGQNLPDFFGPKI